MDELTRAAEVLGSATEVALACHLDPDADALGSMLGLSAFLRARGTTTVCSFPNEPLKLPRWASFLPGSDDLVEVADYPDAPAVMVTCDCASFDRLGALGAAASNAGGGHLDRPSPLERRARDDPAGRSGRVVHVRDGVPADRGDGWRHAGRDRGLPVRRARDGHRPVPVRGDHAGDAPHRRRAPRASVRSRAHGAGAVRGQPPRVPARRGGRAGAGHGRAGRRPRVDVPDAGRPGRRRRRPGARPTT